MKQAASLALSEMTELPVAGLSRRLRLVGPLLVYLLAGLLATWPLVTHLAGWVPGLGDWGQNLWALWWTRHALLALAQSPFTTNYLFYPEGVTLLFHPLDVSDGLLALPLYPLLGGGITYNVMVLLSFVLGGWGAYLLALELTGRRLPALVAGLVFALSPYHFLRIELGHLNLSTFQWIPFYVLFLLKFVRSGARRPAFLAVFFLVFNALNSWYYVVYCGLLSLLVVFWPGTGRPVLRLVVRVGGVLLAALLLLAPLWLPMLRLMGATGLVGEHNPLRHSVDLVSFWAPGPPSTWAGFFEEIWQPYAAGHREPGASAYLGYTVLGLAAAALLDRDRRGRVVWWWLVVLGFTLLALGPRLQIGGQILALSLPYGLLAEFVPGFELAGIPGRFVVITSLALAVLTAYGLAFLAGRGRPALIGRGGWRLAVVAGLLVGLEYLAVPIRLSPTAVPDFYRAMGADRDHYAILDIKWDANYLLYAQTVHGKPLVGGWLARLPKSQAAYLDQGSLDRVFLYLLFGPEGAPAEPRALKTAIQAALRERRVCYIVDHDGQAGAWLEPLVGWPVWTGGPEQTVYASPDCSP